MIRRWGAYGWRLDEVRRRNRQKEQSTGTGDCSFYFEKMKEIELFEMVNYDIEIQMMDIANCFRNTGKKDDAHEHS